MSDFNYDIIYVQSHKEIDFTNIRNIKILNELKNYIKNIIKLTSNKHKVIVKQVNEIKNKIQKLEIKKEKIDKKNKKNKKFLCDRCYISFTSYKDYNNHTKINCSLYQLHKNKNDKEYKEIIFTIKNEYNNVCKLNQKLLYEEKILKKYEPLYDYIIDLIKNIKLQCQNCLKKNVIIDNCKCTYNHNLCTDCFDKVDNKCPVCNDIIKCEMCPICMSNKNELIDIKCSNHHKICADCNTKILMNKHLCPFCRNIIK